MQIINRTMRVSKSETTEYGNVQASINSDGRITLRTVSGAQTDTIVVLSEKETRAIFELLKQIKTLGVALPELPF